MGSGEFEPWVCETELEALGGATGDGTVVVLPTASASEGDAVFDRWSSMGLDHYRSMGVRADVLPVKVRDDARREDLAARAAAASMIFFSGGSPKRLAEVLVDTPLWTSVLAAVDRGAVFAGCSAGAMVASQARTEETLRRGRGSGWLFGLGIVPGVSFGVHWDRTRWIPGVRAFTRSRLARGGLVRGHRRTHGRAGRRDDLGGARKGWRIGAPRGRGPRLSHGTAIRDGRRRPGPGSAGLRPSGLRRGVRGAGARVSSVAVRPLDGALSPSDRPGCFRCGRPTYDPEKRGVPWVRAVRSGRQIFDLPRVPARPRGLGRRPGPVRRVRRHPPVGATRRRGVSRLWSHGTRVSAGA